MERQFVEVIIAPKVSAEAQEVVKRKKNVRLLECGEWTSRSERLDFKRVNGGLLVQDADLGMVGVDDLKVVSKRQPTEQELKRFIILLESGEICEIQCHCLCQRQSNYRHWCRPNESSVFSEDCRYQSSG